MEYFTAADLFRAGDKKIVPATSPKLLRNLTLFSVAAVCLLGVLLRFYHITRNEFFFYDEGLYLNLHRKYLELIAGHLPKTWYDFWGALYLCLRLSLGEGKALYIFLSHLRVFVGGLEAWFFPRIISAVAGSLTLFFTYLFAKRYFGSKRAGWLSVIILAVMPSHIFYSRMALQETFCTLLFLIGFYLYLFPARLNARTFLSAIFLVLAYFSNYRLIILPILVFACEVFSSQSERQRPDFRKYLWHTLIFLFLVFLIGSIDRAQNTIVTFAWMFYQTQMAEKVFEPFNFLSHPYYVFKLEGFLFGILFFGNVYCLARGRWQRLLPFFLACFHMFIFSFTAEKAMRYVCVVIPFMAVAAGSFIDLLYEEKKSTIRRVGLGFVAALMLISLAARSLRVAQFSSDYENAIKYLKGIDPKGKVVSTQPLIENLYTDPKDVADCPKEYPAFVKLYERGFRYLIIDPQVYISWTDSGRRFDRRLKNYLQFITSQIKPVKAFPHFHYETLERFVFEHNENLKKSLLFLKSHDNNLGTLKIYDIKICVDEINRRLAARNAALKE